MKVSARLLLTLALLGLSGFAAEAQMIVTLGSGFNRPSGVAVDGQGNVFVADEGNAALKEILATGGGAAIQQIGSVIATPISLVVDSQGDIFVPGANSVEEIVAVNGVIPIA
jgi:DNA-binding beta-propeller fold protein YncE